MRLTQNLRSDFINKVMNDVPRIDYAQLIEEYLVEECKKMMPEDLVPLFDKYPDWVPDTYFPIQFRESGLWWTRTFQLSCPSDTKFSKEVMEHVKKLALSESSQSTSMRRLRSSLTNQLYSCRTCLDVQEVLPEFYFYLPETNSKPRKLNSPLKREPDHGLIAQFVAAGWKRPVTSL